MSLIIRVKGANYSNTTRPKLLPYRYGFPKTNLQALYLMEEGTVGAVHAGSFVDSSGNANHAPMKAGWTQPTRRDYGMELAAGGLAALSPVAFGTKFTFIIGLAMNEGVPAATRYPVAMATQTRLPATPASQVSVTGTGNDRSFLNGALQTTGAGSYGLVNSVSPFPSSRLQIGAAAVGKLDGNRLIGMSYDGTTGNLILRDSNGDAATGNMAGMYVPAELMGFGLMPYSPGQPPIAGSKLFLAGMWADSSDALLVECLGRGVERVAARGVVLAP